MSKVQTRYIPPDPVALQLVVRKKMLENKESKYFMIRVFRKYRIASSIEFESSKNRMPQTTPQFFHSEEHNMWLLAKMYIPLNSEVKRLEKVQKFADGSMYDRVGVKLPEKVTIEIEAQRLWPVNVRKQLINYLKKNCRDLFATIYTPKDSKDQFFLLTEKNWDVTNEEPNKDNSFSMKISEISSLPIF